MKVVQFFEKLGLLSLLNESERHSVISRAVDRLWIAHQGLNNFYNEPPFAERLYQISKQGAIPETIQEAYVIAIVGCYIGNGYGYSWAAESYYEDMIRSFSPLEIVFMIHIPKSKSIVSSRISSGGLCKSRFIKALTLLDPKSVPNSAEAEYKYILGS